MLNEENQKHTEPGKYGKDFSARKVTPLGHQKLSSSKEKYIECIDNFIS